MDTKKNKQSSFTYIHIYEPFSRPDLSVTLTETLVSLFKSLRISVHLHTERPYHASIEAKKRLTSELSETITDTVNDFYMCNGNNTALFYFKNGTYIVPQYGIVRRFTTTNGYCYLSERKNKTKDNE